MNKQQSSARPESSVVKPRHNPLFLYVTSFVAGFVVLTLEILGFRLFAPYFGYSVYVSGSLITMVLVALASGYYLGGRIADRHPSLHLLYVLIMTATAYLAVVALVFKPTLAALSSWSPVTGTIVATIAIFAVPMLLLSTVSPFLIKVLVREGRGEKVGETVGLISAISTTGSIIGSVAATFLLIPAIGARATLLVCCACLFVVCIGYLAARNVRQLAWLAIPVVAVAGMFIPEKKEPGLLFEKESVYNRVQVLRNGDRYVLRLNDAGNLQSVFPVNYSTGDITVGNYIDLMAVGPVLSGGKRALVLGLGGGSGANQLSLLFKASVTAVEIDPVVADVARRYFSVGRINPDIEIHVDDARPFLAKTRRSFDIIEVDLYHGGLYIPFYLATREFFHSVKSHLADGGVMVMNVLCDNVNAGGDDLYRCVGNTLVTEFDSVFVVRTPEIAANAVFYAFRGSPSLSGLRARLYANATDSSARTIPGFVARHLAAYAPDRAHPVFTDDHAPIEEMTFRFVRNFEKNLRKEEKKKS